jgi:hypothetical protein
VPRGLDVGQAQMLKVKTASELERERAERSRSAYGCFSSNGGRWPVGDGQVRKDFEEEGVMEMEQWKWEMELPM